MNIGAVSSAAASQPRAHVAGGSEQRAKEASGPNASRSQQSHQALEKPPTPPAAAAAMQPRVNKFA
jgi:hypothetical protein